MSINDQLSQDLVTAMKAHDNVTKDTLRFIKAALQNAEIEKGRELDDAGSNEVMARMAKQYRDSITTFGDAGRTDLVDKESSELNVLLHYLPEQINEGQIRALAQEAVSETGAVGAGDRGKVMGKLMPQLKGKADGALVNKVVGELLESL
jgi:uncharacterized protein YqeY